MDGSPDDFEDAPTMTVARGAIFRLPVGRSKWVPRRFRGVVSKQIDPFWRSVERVLGPPGDPGKSIFRAPGPTAAPGPGCSVGVGTIQGGPFHSNRDPIGPLWI